MPHAKDFIDTMKTFLQIPGPMQPTNHAALPDSVETLLDWKLSNSDEPFNDEEFLTGFAEHAQQANALFAEVVADFHRD